METIISIPPPIIQYFDEHLLMTYLQRVQWKIENKIKPLAVKKIRIQDMGKKKQFNELLHKYEALYERKTKEEKDYNEKIKNSKKVPHLPASKGIIKFKRMDTR